MSRTRPRLPDPEPACHDLLGRRLRRGGIVDGLRIDFQLTLPHILRRVETYYGGDASGTRLPHRSFHHTTWSETTRRAKQLAVALDALGLERGDRVGTLC